MTNKERNQAKTTVFENIEDVLMNMGAVNYGGEFDFAVPVVGEDGKTTFVTVELTAKNNTEYTAKGGKVVKAFNPDAEKEAYEAAQVKKAQDAAARKKKDKE